MLTKADLAWILPVVLVVLALIGFLIRILVKYFTKTLEDRMTKIDGGTDPTKGSIAKLKDDFEEIEDKVRTLELEIRKIGQLGTTVEEAKKGLEKLRQELTELKTSLPKDYTLKPDCISQRVTIENHLTNLVNKVDRMLETLSHQRR